MEEVFKYVLIAVAASFILFFGYKMIGSISVQGCSTDIAKFEIDLKGMGANLRFGARELQTYPIPCRVDRIYLFDMGRGANPGDFDSMPIIKDALISESRSNVFLIKENDVTSSFYAGDFKLDSPYICLRPKAGRVSFFTEGAGRYSKITLPGDQPQCS